MNWKVFGWGMCGGLLVVFGTLFVIGAPWWVFVLGILSAAGGAALGAVQAGRLDTEHRRRIEAIDNRIAEIREKRGGNVT